MRAILVVGVVAVCVGVALRAAGPVMWFVEAALVAALAAPVLGRMRRHMPAAVAVLALTAAALVVVGVLGAVAFSELHDEAFRFRDSVPSAVRDLQRDKPFGGLMEDLKVAEQVDRLSDGLAERFELGADLPGLATALGGKVSTGFIIWVLSVMLVFTGPGMVDATVGLLPDRAARAVGPALRRAYGDVVRYLGLTSLRALVVGVAVYAVASALGIDMPALLAVVAAVCAYIPYVGLVLGGLPLALLAVLNGTTEAALIFLGAVAAQTIDSLVVQPRIDRRSFSFGMFPTLVVAIIGFGLYGVVGLFLGIFAGALLLALGVELGPDLGMGRTGPAGGGDGATDAGEVLDDVPDELPVGDDGAAVRAGSAAAAGT
ncbi:AI-2E family transporter [Dermatobacter hominis]|uniref:AI-2E family transporter n=1 Tax=Dermatobacter hominis TaxID=2884263 RepID=UPI001D10A88E|nr:AI-2E family transporter [Dermatobacter hominis]UDY33991.1 AI-2E family transporter [Dermatobacter hominis]